MMAVTHPHSKKKSNQPKRFEKSEAGKREKKKEHIFSNLIDMIVRNQKGSDSRTQEPSSYVQHDKRKLFVRRLMVDT